MQEILLYFALKYNGDFMCIYNAIEKKEKVDEQLFIELKKEMKCQYTTIISTDYPMKLRQIDCPPFVLFYYGDLSLLDYPTIAVVGKRRASSYGQYATKEMVKEIVKRNYVVVSGMALGIDSMAHQNTISLGGKTIAVLGSGIDYCYPKSNMDLYQLLKENHLILSEYPGFVKPRKDYFPKRNRIVAGVSEKTLVIEADIKSGTMITVGYTLDQGKDVFCIPSRITDPQGCNSLISMGAKIVVKSEDIFYEETW